MEQNRINKKLFLIIPITLVLIAGAVFGFLYIPAQKTYRNALKASAELPYDEACAVLNDAIRDLNGKPLFAEKQSELTVLLGDLVYAHTFKTAMGERGTLPFDEACATIENALKMLEGKPQYAGQYETLQAEYIALRSEEIDRAIDAGETEYALNLIRAVPENQAPAFYDKIYAKAEALAKDGKKLDAIELFQQLGSYSDAERRIAALREQLRFDEAAAVFTGENYDEGIKALLALGTEQGDAAAEELTAQKITRRAALREQGQASIAVGAWHTAWLSDGVVRFSGDARYSVPETAADRVFSGLSSIVGLKDGRVILFGESFGNADAIKALSGVTDMALGLNHALFLLDNGTVKSVGSKALGKLNTENWANITDVAAGAWHSVGCKTDGTVVSIGGSDLGQCDTADWRDIVSVDAGLWHTIGLKADGTVTACGDNTYGQCDVSDWTDIAAISCGACYTIGLKTDGTVVACGDNAAGQCDVSGWTEVAAVDAGAYHTAAVRMDGTLLSAGLVPHETLPEAPVFESNYAVDPIAASAATENAMETCYIEGLDSELGPWLYLDPHGAALICIDDSEERPPFRVDLLATANALPGGHVTQPEASGRVIHMDTEMPELQAQKAHAVVAFTGDYIGFSSNRKGVMIRDGVTYYDRDEIGSMAIMPDGTLQYYEKGEVTAAALLEKGVRDSFSFRPLLVQDGKSMLEGQEFTEYTMRVALGYSDPYHYITLVSLRDRLYQLTHKQSAEIMLRYGAKLAYNLDGGHSTSLAFMGRELSLVSLLGGNHRNIRALSDIVVFLTNPAVQVPPEPLPEEPAEEPTEEPPIV